MLSKKVILAILQLQVLTTVTVSQSEANDTVQLIHQYQPIIWVENLAVRPNGNILPITTTSPLLNQLNPHTGDLELVHDFSAHGNAIQGITEIDHDAYVVDVLTCNITALTCTPGNVSAWLVDFNHGGHYQGSGAVVRQLAEFPTAGFLNGMAALGPDTVLLADSYLGGIWSLSTVNGETSLLFTDDSLAPTASIATGINGLRVRPGRIYFTNSAKGTFNTLPIDPLTGLPTGTATVIASGLSAPDDFEIDDSTGIAYVCNGALDEVLEIPIQGVNVTASELAVAATVPGPTSVRWANRPRRNGHGARGTKPSKVLYASTIGGLLQYIQHNVTEGGAVYAMPV